jgi:hypothetical protein
LVNATVRIAVSPSDDEWLMVGADIAYLVGSVIQGDQRWDHCKFEYFPTAKRIPSSIRLYAPPLPVERLQPHLGKDVVKFAGAYTDLEWGIYGIVLQEVVSRGTFIT